MREGVWMNIWMDGMREGMVDEWMDGWDEGRGGGGVPPPKKINSYPKLITLKGQ